MRLTEKSDDDEVLDPPPPRPAPQNIVADGSVRRRFLDNDAAAEYLCLSPRTLEKLRVIGDGPAFRKLGRRVVYALEDLDIWADRRRQESTSDSDPEWQGEGDD